MLDADVLVLNNICDADLLPVIRYRKAQGKLAVYELCYDLEALLPTSPMRAFYSRSNNMLLIRRLAHYEAIDMEPSFYLPYLFGAFVSNDPTRTLKNTVERKPRSIVSLIHLDKAYLWKGMATEAIESFKAAADIFPEYMLPYIECARCLHKMGLEQEGTSFLKNAADLISKAIRAPEGFLEQKTTRQCGLDALDEDI